MVRSISRISSSWARSAGGASPAGKARVSIWSKMAVRRAQRSSVVGGSVGATWGRDGTCMGAGPGASSLGASSRRTWISACASTGRCSGFFSSSARISSSKRRGQAGFRLLGRGGGSCMCLMKYPVIS